MYTHLQQHPCVDCGEDRVVLLEYDHVSGEKKGTISGMIRMAVDIGTILEEMSKCVVRCCSCHKLKTAREKGWTKLNY